MRLRVQKDVKGFLEALRSFDGVYLNAVADAIEAGSSIEEAHVLAVEAVEAWVKENQDWDSSYPRIGEIVETCTILYTSWSGKKYEMYANDTFYVEFPLMSGVAMDIVAKKDSATISKLQKTIHESVSSIDADVYMR